MSVVNRNESFQYVFCLLIQMSLLFAPTIWTLCSVSLTSICTPAVFCQFIQDNLEPRGILGMCGATWQRTNRFTAIWVYIIIWHALSEASCFSYNNEILPPLFPFFCHYSDPMCNKTNVFIKWIIDTDCTSVTNKWRLMLISE